MSNPLRSRRDFMKITGCVIAGGIAASYSKAFGDIVSNSKTNNFPNILFVLVDDMGYGDLPEYNPDSKLVLPNIQKLIKRGMLFSDAHSPSAVCAPTRYSVLTGNYPCRGRKVNGTWRYNDRCQILDGQETLGDLLKIKGYHTAMFGKLHMGGHFYSKTKENECVFPKSVEGYREIDFSKNFERGPLDYGFDYSFLALNGVQGRPYAFFENDKLVGDPNQLKFWQKGTYGDSVIQFDGFGVPDWDTTKMGFGLMSKAIEFIDKHHRDNIKNQTQRPFFMHYCSPAPHVPCTPPEELCNVKIKNQSLTPYTDMLLEIDTTLGQIMAELQERDILKDTMIVFTSDNGAWPEDDLKSQGHYSNAPLRGNKAQIWEGGHRVPLVVCWGDGTPEGSQIPPDSRCDQLLGLQDFYATFAELTEQKIEKGQAIDSVSVLPLLLQKTKKPVREYLVIQSNWNEPGKASCGPGAGKFFRAIRENEWKLTVNDEEEPIELYNLKEDLQEAHNLINEAEHQKRIQRMLNKYKEIMKS